MNQRRLRERFTEIVRSTEGYAPSLSLFELDSLHFATRRMVNVASQVPFNLHNRVIPQAQSHSSSRSTLDYVNPHHDHPYYSDFYSTRDLARLRKERSKYYHGLGRLRSISPSFHGSEVDPSSRTRSPSPSGEQPSAARLLNIRLVGYTDIRTRGRARERAQHPTGLPGSKESENHPAIVEAVSGSRSPEGSPSLEVRRPVC